ncbi:MAG TPA: hypothetical protein VGI67_21710 [Thermoleophilaceae bacterium]
MSTAHGESSHAQAFGAPSWWGAGGPVIGLFAQLLLIAVLGQTIGLNSAAWVVGVTCAVGMSAGLALGLSHFGSERLAPADWITLTRGTLAVAVAALVADSFGQSVPLKLLVSLAAVALGLDAVDGWVARRTATGTLGAHFDAEVDAFLILVLSVYVSRTLGAWVLAIGAARYGFLVAGWALPWMRATLPPRYWRKFVAATQGIVLTAAAADAFPPAVTRAAVLGALILLAESFGHDVWWLRSNRNATDRRAPVGTDHTPGTPAGPRRGRLRTGAAAALTILALLLVWGALVAPDQPVLFKPSAFVRLPLEGLVVLSLVVLLPPRARRVLVLVVGPLLALVVLLKMLDLGFFAAFNRPFDPYQDVSYAGTGAETLRASIGHAQGNLVIAFVVALVVALFVLMTLAVRRLSRIAAGNRRWSIRAVAGLGAAWLLLWLLGASFISHTPIASTSAASLAADEVNAFRAGIRDHAVFAKEVSHDPLRETPANQLLTRLRGKDVLLAFVESYGKVAVQDSSFSPQIDAVLNSGTTKLQAAGFSARSGWLTSPTFGGISWLAHSTMQSGVWANSRRRYGQLLTTNRFTLSDAFKRAGWRTVSDSPSNDRAWSPGKTFYHYDKLYDRRNVGYEGPTFAYASMPDQYVLGALQRLELSKAHRRPVFAEIDLVSSHTPWTRIPRMIPWSQLGNGSIFNKIPVAHTSKSSLSVNAAWAWLGGSGAGRIRAAYGQSIQYTLNSMISFVQHYRDPNLVLIMLGDHQPWSIVSGQGASHDVPISVIAHDPKVLSRISGWGWNNGLQPSPRAPVWPMSAFRDRFLSAFDSSP